MHTEIDPTDPAVNLLAAVCAKRGEEFFGLADMDEWEAFWKANTTDGADDSELVALGGHDACLALARNCELVIGGGAAPRVRVGFVGG